MVNVLSATVINPTRVVVAELAATWYDTGPLPVPGLPPVTASQEALLVAVHEQSPGAVTANVPRVSSVPTSTSAGEMS